MKKNSNKISWKLIILCFACFIAIAVWITYKRHNVKVDIMQNMGYSIGTVQLILTPSTNQRSAGDASIYFSLDINDLIYKKQKDKGLSNNKYKKMKIGERYMVVYDTTNIENCILLVDYPVRDSIDYFRYMEEFKNQPFDLNGEFQTPLYRLLFSND